MDRGDDDVVLLTGGDPVSPDLVGDLPPRAYVIAADSGLDQAAILGLHVDLAVGDFDSLAPAALEAAMAAGCRVERHPAAKDHTDLELGLRAALEHGCRRVVVVGGYGGRLDHFLANVLVLASVDFAGVVVEARVGPARLTVVRARSELRRSAGALVSLLALGGVARGVRTVGLRYPLRGEDLLPGSTRGVSNELTGEVASVAVAGGALLAVQPGPTRVRRRTT
ncbi:MAG: thiamine diphosphokinase [Actinobacteria bacterium]|nr:thiamine diphosphokinase [Actinomycetota bacterium]